MESWFYQIDIHFSAEVNTSKEIKCTRMKFPKSKGENSNTLSWVCGTQKIVDLLQKNARVFRNRSIFPLHPPQKREQKARAKMREEKERETEEKRRIPRPYTREPSTWQKIIITIREARSRGIKT